MVVCDRPDILHVAHALWHLAQDIIHLCFAPWMYARHVSKIFINMIILFNFGIPRNK